VTVTEWYLRTADVGLDEWRSRGRIGVNYHVRRDVISLDPVAIRDLYDQFPDWRRASTRPNRHAHELSEFVAGVTVGDRVYAVESESQRVLVGVISGPYRYEDSDARTCGRCSVHCLAASCAVRCASLVLHILRTGGRLRALRLRRGPIRVRRRVIVDLGPVTARSCCRRKASIRALAGRRI
jgi:hypothetical protein